MAELLRAPTLLVPHHLIATSSSAVDSGRTRGGWKERYSKQECCVCMCSNIWGELSVGSGSFFISSNLPGSWMVKLGSDGRGRGGGSRSNVGDHHHHRQGSSSIVVMANLVNDVVANLPVLDGTLKQTVQQLASQDTGSLIQLGSTAISSFAELPDGERWKIASGSAFGWFYLTARPGVLKGALDSYVLAPLQFLVDGALGRRNWKRTDFLVDERLGEGSFGTVYAGFVLPRKLATDQDDDEFGRRGRRIEEYKDYKSFDKVILKKATILLYLELALFSCCFVFWVGHRHTHRTNSLCFSFFLTN